MRGTALTLLACLTLTAISASEAHAGRAPGTTVIRIEVTRTGDVMATLSAGSDTLQRVGLAGVVTRSIFRSGRGCPRQGTDFAIAERATAMGLSRTTFSKRTGSRTYLSHVRPHGAWLRKTLNYAIVSAGLARVSHAGTHTAALRAAQHRAQRSHRGLWSRCN
jgi:hypothetical protein